MRVIPDSAGVIEPAAERGSGGAAALLPGAPDTFDARLALGAAVAWIVVFAAQQLSVRAVYTAAVVAAGLGLAALAADRIVRPAPVAVPTSHASSEVGDSAEQASVGRSSGWRRFGAAGALACFCSAGTLWSLGAHVHQLRSGPVPGLVARRAAGVFTVTLTGDPRVIVSSISFAAPRVSIDATLTDLRSGAARYRVRVPVVVLAAARTWSALVPGQRLSLDGRLSAAPPGAFLAASLSARGPPTLIGRAPWWQRDAVTIRRDLVTAAGGLPSAERGLLPGLVDGDISGLDPQLAVQFKAAGLTHLVAVSGTNAAILIGAVLLVLRRLRVPPWLCAVIGAGILLAFVVVARASPSVIRAAVMAVVLLFALATGRPRQGLPSLALAVLVLLMWHPDWAGNAGFAMSALATGALFLIAPGWADALRRHHVPPVLAEGLAVAAAATAVSAPIIVLISGRVSLVSLPANVLAEFVVAPATVLGVLAAACAPWSPFLGAAFAQAAGVPCRWLVADARWFAGLPDATVSWPKTVGGAAGLVVLIVVGWLLIRLPVTRRPLIAVVVTVAVLQIPGHVLAGGWAPGGTILVACDVGQGDGIVLPVGHHQAVVMDSGPEPLAIDRCLHSLGVTSVPVYIQSHFDLDHVGGVAGVADHRRLGQVLTGPLQSPALGRGILTGVLAPLGITSQIVPAGTVISEGPLRLQVLESHVVDVDGQPDSNNSSLIIRATVAGHTILLTGDASIEAQQALLQSGQDIASDVLKVPHHGSAYFDPEFLRAVHPQFAVISVGLHNSYGQPAPKLLSALAELHVPVRRTDLDGDVAVVATGSGLQVLDHQPSAQVSAGGLPGVQPPGRQPVGAVQSDCRATMTPCPPPPSPPAQTSPAITITASSWSPATRPSWSGGPSSRSPPPAGAPTPKPRWWNERERT